MVRLHPRQPRISSRDLVLRESGQGWVVEDAAGRPVCEVLSSIAEARLISRTLVLGRGRVWLRKPDGWSILDVD